jgi:hypothetical protein
MTLVVFSKDRALQLDAFLQSYRDQVIPLLPMHVFYAGSTGRHLDAYAQVFHAHPFAVPVVQTILKADVLEILRPHGTVTCFVDDQVWVRPWRVLERPGLSLRLAPHLTHCYPMNCPQPVPVFEAEGLDLLSWRWSEGAYDWGYPLSIDGHVFDAREFRSWVEAINFQTPNGLEGQLQRFAPAFDDRRGSCYTLAKVVNVPWNRVQSECQNRAGWQAPADALLARWEAGERVDVAAMYDVVNVSAHQELPLAVVAR